VRRQALDRGDRYQILPAYTILLYPAKNSVIVMDNVSIHHSENIRQLCADAGVILVYLPPYFPDYNPIEEFLSEVKVFVKEYWRLYLDTTDRSHQAFRKFLTFCVLEVS
jgi:transposase